MKRQYPKLIKLIMALALVAGLVSLVAAPAAACTTFEFEFYPPSGPPGTEVTIYYVSGVNEKWVDMHPAFEADSTIFGGIPVSHPWGPMHEGSFSIEVPAVPPGDYEVELRDAYAYRDTFIFTVTGGPVTHNPSTIVGHTLERLDGQYERVWGYDGATQSWQVYDSSKSAQRINDLQVLERMQTIWIDVTADDVVFNWRGTLYFLGKGWNLITALGDTYGIGAVITVPPPG